MGPLIITVAGVGAEVTREQQPALPVAPDEIAADAAECRAAGAAVYHLHVRDELGRPTMSIETFRRAHDAIRAATDVIVQFTSGGAVSDSEEERIAPLELRPEMASLTTGTVNFGDDVFSNPIPLVRRFYERMLSLGVMPEFEIFEAGMIATATRLYEELGASHSRHFDLVLGVPGAMPAWPSAIEFLTDKLPPGSTWSATGIGRSHPEVAAAAIASGGHVRTGFEDVRFVGPGEPAPSNASLVRLVAERGRAAGRAPATPKEARRILGLETV